MSNYFSYKKGIVFHPGYYIKECIDYYGFTQEEYARRLGTTPKNLSILIRGEQSLSIDIAAKLSLITGINAETWLVLQKKYDAALADIRCGEILRGEKKIVGELGYGYFRKLYSLENIKNAEMLREILGVSSLSVLKEPNSAACFRASLKGMTERNIIRANAMLLIAVNEALKIENIPQYDKTKFEKKIDYVLTLTTKGLDDAIPEIREVFSEAGVILVVLPNIDGSKIYGATKRLRKNMLLFVNDRYKTVDSFWFTLLHEAGHIINGNLGATLENGNEEKEKSAEKYAMDKLIPEKEYWDFFSKRDYGKESVISFASFIGRDPGIVVARLQRDGAVSYSDSLLNSLKRNYSLDIHLDYKRDGEFTL